MYFIWRKKKKKRKKKSLGRKDRYLDLNTKDSLLTENLINNGKKENNSARISRLCQTTKIPEVSLNPKAVKM